MKLKNFDLKKKVFIIAEVGNNHEGNFNVAKKLIHLAAKAGADAIKFQTFKTENFIRKKDIKRITAGIYEDNYIYDYDSSRKSGIGIYYCDKKDTYRRANFLRNKL